MNNIIAATFESSAYVVSVRCVYCLLAGISKSTRFVRSLRVLSHLVLANQNRNPMTYSTPFLEGRLSRLVRV